jgi:hypothetical protein
MPRRFRQHMQAQRWFASVMQSTKELVRGRSSFGHPKSARLATLKITVLSCEEEDYKSSGTGRPLFRSEDVSEGSFLQQLAINSVGTGSTASCFRHSASLGLRA